MAAEKAAAEQKVKDQEQGAQQLEAAAAARVAREVESAGVVRVRVRVACSS